MPFPFIFVEDLWSFGLGVNSASKVWTPHLSVCLQFSFSFSCWMSIVWHRPSPMTSTGPCFGRHIAGILWNNSSCPSNLSLVFLGSLCVPSAFSFSCWMSIVRHRPSPLTSTGPCSGWHIAGILWNNSSCPLNFSLVFLVSLCVPSASRM